MYPVFTKLRTVVYFAKPKTFVGQIAICLRLNKLVAIPYVPSKSSSFLSLFM